jgi:intracellular multiplication protein IcmK
MFMTARFGGTLLLTDRHHVFARSFLSGRSGLTVLALTTALVFSPFVAQAQSATTYASPQVGSTPDAVSAMPSTQQNSAPVLQQLTSNPGGTLPKPTSNRTDAESIPLPAPPSSLTIDANDLASQAEQAAMQAQAEADAAQLRKEQEHNRKSYDRAQSGLLPLSTDQIHTFMKRLEDTQSASVMPSSGSPIGKVRITTLSLDPGTEPPTINLAAGYVTTINMLDATGEPWPIMDVGIGGNFEVSPTPAGTHIVRVMPLTRVGTGDLSVLLKDLPTPVIFRLSAGGPTVDLRHDARVPKFGPNAKIPLVDHPRLEAGDETIMMLLQNAPPKDAKRMKISGLDARSMAWNLGDHVYVRTPLTLLSPSWSASVSSADGMTVYDIGDAPVLLMSDNGAIVRARLSRDDDHDK